MATIPEILAAANRLAADLGNAYINPEHMLDGLLEVADERTLELFRAQGVEPATVASAIKQWHIRVTESLDPAVRQPFTPVGRRVLTFAAEEARTLHHESVGDPELLLALLRGEFDGHAVAGQTIACQVLRERGMTYNRTRELVCNLRKRV